MLNSLNLSSGDCLLIATSLARSISGHDEAIKASLENKPHSVASAEMAMLLRRKNRLQSLVRLFNEASNDARESEIVGLAQNPPDEPEIGPGEI